MKDFIEGGGKNLKSIKEELLFGFVILRITEGKYNGAQVRRLSYRGWNTNALPPSPRSIRKRRIRRIFLLERTTPRTPLYLFEKSKYRCRTSYVPTDSSFKRGCRVEDSSDFRPGRLSTLNSSGRGV